MFLSGGWAEDNKYRITASPFSSGGRTLVLLSLEDISELVTLRRIVSPYALTTRIAGATTATGPW